MNNDKPILIVGLGNPGAEYARTRHNAGFMAIDAIAGDDAIWKKEKNALTTRLASNQSNLKLQTSNFKLLAKPQTFMNDSGTAVAALMKYYKIPIENLIVIHDDMDIRLGDIREKIGGSSAGHNGIKSIDAAVGPEYWRIRIGVGHPPSLCELRGTSPRSFGSPMAPPAPRLRGASPVDWVLGKFSDTDMKAVNAAIEKVKNELRIMN